MKILVAGDFCPQHQVAELLNKEDYQPVLGDAKRIISSADYAIVNFECPIANEDDKPITKAGPNLGCSINGIKAVKWAGFDGVTLANNHFNDYGENGVKKTLMACKEMGLDTVGGGMNLGEAAQILYKEICGKKLAIINCCEHESSIATDKTAGSNPLNPIQQYYAIKEAKGKADYVLVIVHGGHEHHQLPSPRMQETYRFFVDAGADVVINHHQHCYSGYENYHGKPIFYGLGNFCFDKKKKMKDIWYEGYMVMIRLEEIIKYEIVPYSQCLTDVKVSLVNYSVIKKKIEELNRVISEKKLLEAETMKYYQSCKWRYLNVFEPIRNKIYLYLKKRNVLPSLISHKRKLVASSFICCESHRDILAYLLRGHFSDN